MDTPHTARHFGPYVPPPLIYAVILAAALAAEGRWALPFPPGPWALAVGVGFAIPASVALLAVLHFRRARTSPFPWDASNALVTGGPYRYTRNPMYLGLAALVLSAAGFSGSLWPALTLPISIVLVVVFAIRPEERYLEARFGDAYRAYRARVRRWL
jgi:protein-S-isoprenylcysteine O-methyltransferase Ste14